MRTTELLALFSFRVLQQVKLLTPDVARPVTADPYRLASHQPAPIMRGIRDSATVLIQNEKAR